MCCVSESRDGPNFGLESCQPSVVCLAHTLVAPRQSNHPHRRYSGRSMHWARCRQASLEEKQSSACHVDRAARRHQRHTCVRASPRDGWLADRAPHTKRHLQQGPERHVVLARARPQADLGGRTTTEIWQQDDSQGVAVGRRGGGRPAACRLARGVGDLILRRRGALRRLDARSVA